MERSVLRLTAVAGVAAVSLVLAAGTAAAAPTKTTCPSASVVNAVLGQHVKAPTSTTTPYGTTCTYKGSGIVPTKIEYQKDTAASFAAGEKSAGALGTLVKVSGLGKAAYGPKSGGFLAVFLGSRSIRITAPFISLSQLEKLAHKLI